MATRNSIVGALPALTTAFAALTDRASKEGISFRIADFGGLRTEDDTNLILKYRLDDWNAAVKKDPALASRTTMQAWRPVSPWGSSMHNYGAAFDVLITGTSNGMSTSTALDRVRNLAGQVGLTTIAGDPPHLELPGGRAKWEPVWLATTGTARYLGGSPANVLLAVAVVGVVALLSLSHG